MAERTQPTRAQARSSIATKVILLVMSSTFLTALIVSWISVQSTYGFLRQRLDQAYPAVLAHTEERLVGWLGEGRTDLARLAREPGVTRALASGTGRVPDLLAERVAGSRFFEALVVADAEGELVHRAGTVPEPGAPTESWRVHGETPVLRALGNGTTRDRLVASLSFGSRGHSLHGVFRRTALRGLLDVEGLGTARSLCLVDERGQRVAPLCSNPAQAGGQAQVPNHPNAAAHLYRGGSGERMVGASREIALLDWRLLVEEPVHEAFQPVFQMVTRVVALDLCILLAFGFLAFKITRAIVRPMEALSDGARRITRGDLEFELPTTERRDEVGLLTEAFREMTRKLLSQQREVQQANTQLQGQNDDLQRANEVLEQLSITDGLTKLHNHRFFQDHLTREIKRASRSREALAMLVIDIDDFKKLNDRQGHKAGDELLVGLARILTESSRENDFVARYGGEEFVVVAPSTELAGAVALAEKIRASVEEASFILGDSKRLTKVSISVGVAQYKGNRRAFFQSADQALYRAKAAGKNCVIADEET